MKRLDVHLPGVGYRDRVFAWLYETSAPATILAEWPDGFALVRPLSEIGPTEDAFQLHLVDTNRKRSFPKIIEYYLIVEPEEKLLANGLGPEAAVGRDTLLASGLDERGPYEGMLRRRLAWFLSATKVDAFAPGSTADRMMTRSERRKTSKANTGTLTFEPDLFLMLGEEAPCWWPNGPFAEWTASNS